MIPTFYSYLFQHSNQTKLDLYHVNYYGILSYYSKVSTIVYTLLHFYRKGLSSLRLKALGGVWHTLASQKNFVRLSVSSKLFLWQLVRSQQLHLGCSLRNFSSVSHSDVSFSSLLVFSRLYFVQTLWLKLMRTFVVFINKLIILPKKGHVFTVLRSPHTDKKSREQFIYNYYKGLFCAFWYAKSLSEIAGLVNTSGMVRVR